MGIFGRGHACAFGETCREGQTPRKVPLSHPVCISGDPYSGDVRANGRLMKTASARGHVEGGAEGVHVGCHFQFHPGISRDLIFGDGNEPR